MVLSGKKILVTGGAGFIGSAVVRRLKERGVLAHNIKIPRSSEFDLRKFEVCLKVVEGADIVVHLAGVTGSGVLHLSKPGSIFFDNLSMGVNMMEAAHRCGVKKFLDVSSATGYPATATVPLREDDLWNGYPEPSHAPYALANKIRIVQAKAYAAQYGFNAINLILTNVYGPGEKSDRGLVIPAFIERMNKVTKDQVGAVEVWGTGEATRDFLYIDDAAEGICLALERYNKPEPVNLGSGTEISIRELVSRIVHLMDFKGKIHYDKMKPEGSRRRVLDISRAISEFGYSPVNDVEENLKKTIVWHLQNLKT